MDYAIIQVDYSGRILCEIEPYPLITTLKADRPPYKIKNIIDSSVYEEDWDIREDCYVNKKTHMASNLLPQNTIILTGLTEEQAKEKFKNMK